MIPESMNVPVYIPAIEALIAEHQQVKADSAPSSPEWQTADSEITRLRAFIRESIGGAA